MITIQKQIKEPLFSEVLWSKPVNRKAAKQLLIIGGSAGHFQQIELSYEAAQHAGIGSLKLILPQSLRDAVGNLEGCLFVASTKGGSISKLAWPEIKAWSENCDGVLLGGEFSHNADTVSLMEQLLNEIDQPMVITKEIIQSMLYQPHNLFSNTKRVLIADTQTFVGLASKLGAKLSLKPNAGVMNKVHLLEQVTAATGLPSVLVGEDLLIYADNQVSLTPLAQASLPLVAGYLSTFWLQSNDSFKALTTGAFALSQAASHT